jgi:glycosyltransferase involved in cell wall biosynthesis
MVFPSTHEGFGWPLIEAQACGCPVICSDAGPFEEVVGNSAWRIPVEDEPDYAAAVLKLQESAIRHELVTKGMENAKRFEPQADD